MKLKSVHNDCIWCSKRLVHKSYSVDCQENFGPRPRSEEHIIPKSIFGKIVTEDLCKCCNSHFGSAYDKTLLTDQSIIEAAKRVGVTETDLWSRFEGVQRSNTGDAIRICFNKDEGGFRPMSEFQSLDSLSIPIINGIISERDLKTFGIRMVQRVQKRKTALTIEEIEAGVSRLIVQMRRDPTKTYFDSVIEEGVKPTQLHSQVTYTVETKPWETQWCIAKIFFELSQILWPIDYRTYFSPIVEEWRQFLVKRECNSDGTQGLGMFVYEELPSEAAVKQHRIEGVLSPIEMSWSVTFFGTARWRTSIREITPLYPPHYPGSRITIVNPIGVSEVPEIKVTEL